MKILQTPVRFYPFIGGVENYVYHLSEELVKMGHQVKVICANEPHSPKEEVINNIIVERLPYIAKIANTNLTPTLPFKIPGEDFDILHTHLPTPWTADWSAFYAKLKGKPLVLNYYNDIVASGAASNIASLYNKTFLKFLLKQADRIIIIQEDYLKTSPYLSKYADKVRVVPVGVDVDRFKPLDVETEKNSIFFLSLLDEYHLYKGLDYLLESIKIVKEEIKDIKLIVGGKGTLLEHYKSRAESLGIQDNVQFHGFIPEEEIVAYYNRCQIFALPSISSAQEGFGIVALEALACEKPVITTEIVGVSDEIAKEGLGAIVPPKDANALAEGIIKLLSSPDLQEMGERGRAVVEDKFTWKRVAMLTDEIYQELL